MASSDGNDFSGSFTDLMTSLAIVFLILSVGMVIVNALNASENETTGKRYIEELKAVTHQKMDLLDEIKKQFEISKVGSSLATDDNCVSVDASHPFRITIRFNGSIRECLNEGLFFKENEFLLDKSKVEKNLSRIANIYDKMCSAAEMKNQVEDVQIVGHTDAKGYYGDDKNCLDAIDSKRTPVSEEFLRGIQCGNLYLSSQRARTVFVLVGQKIQDRRSVELATCFKSKTQASGRGPFAPKQDIKSGEEIAPLDPQQKRVEIVFSFRQPNPLGEAE